MLIKLKIKYHSGNFIPVAFHSGEFWGTFRYQFRNARIPLEWESTGMAILAEPSANFHSSRMHQNPAGICGALIRPPEGDCREVGAVEEGWYMGGCGCTTKCKYCWFNMGFLRKEGHCRECCALQGSTHRTRVLPSAWSRLFRHLCASGSSSIHSHCRIK